MNSRLPAVRNLQTGPKALQTHRHMFGSSTYGVSTSTYLACTFNQTHLSPSSSLQTLNISRKEALHLILTKRCLRPWNFERLST
jgi:hypothetical protein